MTTVSLLVSSADVQRRSRRFVITASSRLRLVWMRWACDDRLLSGRTGTVCSIVTTGCLLVVLLDNGPTALGIRPDLSGRPRRVGGGCATP
jgi:hypothetical protein